MKIKAKLIRGQEYIESNNMNLLNIWPQSDGTYIIKTNDVISNGDNIIFKHGDIKYSLFNIEILNKNEDILTLKANYWKEEAHAYILYKRKDKINKIKHNNEIRRKILN